MVDRKLRMYEPRGCTPSTPAGDLRRRRKGPLRGKFSGSRAEAQRPVLGKKAARCGR